MVPEVEQFVVAVACLLKLKCLFVELHIVGEAMRLCFELKMKLTAMNLRLVGSIRRVGEPLGLLTRRRAIGHRKEIELAS